MQEPAAGSPHFQWALAPAQLTPASVAMKVQILDPEVHPLQPSSWQPPLQRAVIPAIRSPPRKSTAAGCTRPRCHPCAATQQICNARPSQFFRTPFSRSMPLRQCAQIHSCREAVHRFRGEWWRAKILYLLEMWSDTREKKNPPVTRGGSSAASKKKVARATFVLHRNTSFWWGCTFSTCSPPRHPL